MAGDCAVLPGTVGDAERQGHRQVGQRVLAEILDQQVLEIGPVAGKRHRQVNDDRRDFGRARRPDQSGARRAADRARWWPDPNAPRSHRSRGRAATSRPRRPPSTGPVSSTCGGASAIDPDRPFGIGAANAQAAILHGGKALHRVRRGADDAGAARDRLRQGQLADVAIKADGDLAAQRNVQDAHGHVGQIERRLAGIGRRRDPAFPGGARRQDRHSAGRAAQRLRSAAKGAKAQRRHKGDERHQPQAHRVARGNAQVRLDRMGGAAALEHPRHVRLPDRLGLGIVAANGQRVGDGRDRPALAGWHRRRPPPRSRRASETAARPRPPRPARQAPKAPARTRTARPA